MALNLGGWINNFTVTETQRHKGGYTIYKITSIVFPRSVPQALTCLTVWKRFHDIKRLHRELTRRHKILNLPGPLPPEPTDSSFFKRFDTGVILRRKEYILRLLDFAGAHPALYKCHAFSQFFSDGSTALSASPLHILDDVKGGGAIAEICDKLDMRYDPLEPLYDLPTSPVNECFLTAELPPIDESKTEGDKNDGITKKDVSEEDTIKLHQTQPAESIEKVEVEKVAATSLAEEKPCKDYSRFLTPMVSIESDDSDYIYEAALEFSHAVQAEANLEYEEAHVRYKRGVEVLLLGSKDDSNDDRKFIAKAKIAKYLARSDDIYDRFLRDTAEGNSAGASTINNNFQLSIDVTDCSGNDKLPRPSPLYLERPWNHLAKYKVLQVLGERVMQVQSVTEPQKPDRRHAYVMKGVEKPSSNSPTQSVFLPQHVPYMVDLLAFFQSDQKIFLLLRQAVGGRLCDYISSYAPTMGRRTLDDIAGIFPEVASAESKADQQAANKKEKAPTATFANTESKQLEQTLLAPPSQSTEISELVRCSQQLLQSVSNTLKAVQDVAEEKGCTIKIEDGTGSSFPTAAAAAPTQIGATRIPEASLKQWARELIVAIDSLHCKGVILGDLHMENLLLGAKGELLLTYFYQNEGVSASCAENYVHKAYSPLALDGHFVAPERPLTLKSDWWSYGVVLYQLLLNVTFKSAHPGHIHLYGFVQFPEDCEISENARDLLANLLQQAPEDRFDVEQIRSHAFFKGTKWTEVQQNGLTPSIKKT